jgi:hypothetical protein
MFSFGVRAQLLHPYQTNNKITIMYILIFKLLERRHEDKRLNSMVASIPQI